MTAHISERRGSRRRRLLTGVGAVAVAATAGIGNAAVASAESPHPARAASVSQITFSISQPANSLAEVGFKGGLTNITGQAATGDNMIVFLAQSIGFAMRSGTSGNAGEDLIVGQTTPGTPITGSATVPTGTTITASVNGGAAQTIDNGPFSIQVPAQLGATHRPNPTSATTVRPSTARAGSRVTVSGNAPTTAHAGDWVTLTSDAFASRHTVDGIPAIRTQVHADGTYSVKAALPARLQANTYAITVRCDGHYLPVAWLRVHAG
jgi:hypothetical protein